MVTPIKTDKRHQHRVTEKANELLKEGGKMAEDYYQDGLDKAQQAQDVVKEYSDEVAKKIQQKPLKSLLIAGGVGFLLSLLLRK